MTEICVNRLTVLGTKTMVKRFLESSGWEKAMRARFVEPLELMATRRTWTFQTNVPPVPHLQRISQRWRSLTCLLDYEWETRRVKGIAKAKRGELKVHEVRY